ncbi:hypothetical protein KUV57_11920 [Epibacterium sp. DP7N7-1]|nr:hypothetical protein [Epibacterium sp. DP7N7-1]
MSEKRTFSYNMMRLRGSEQRGFLEALHARLSGEDGNDPIMTGGREARKFIQSLGRKIEAARRERINNRDDVEDLIEAIFEPAFLQDGGLDASAEALQTLRSILGGNWHSPFRPYTYGITEPMEDDPDYGWKSQGAFARQAQRELKVSVRAVSKTDNLQKLRGLVVRRDAGNSEIMLAGAARSKGLAVASIGVISADIPAFDTLNDALRHVQMMSISTIRETEHINGDEAILHDDHLDVLIGDVGEDAGLSALRARCIILEQALTQARDAAIRASDDANLKHVNFSDLVRGTDLEKPYFEIYANYQRSSGNPEEVDALSRAQRRILQLETRVMELERNKPDAEVETGPA